MIDARWPAHDAQITIAHIIYYVYIYINDITIMYIIDVVNIIYESSLTIFLR